MSILFEDDLYAEDGCFFLADALGDPEMPGPWTDADRTRRLLCGDGALVIATAGAGYVPVTLTIHSDEPALDLSAADHAVQGGFSSGGIICLAGDTDDPADAVHAAMPPGPLTVLVVVSGLAGTGAANRAAERYDVHLWPGACPGITVRKQWTGA